MFFPFIVEKVQADKEDLDTFIKLDYFKAKTHMDGMQDKRLNKSRIRWCGLDTFTVNDKADKLRYLFEDPSRLPYYDQEAGCWDLSTKFDIN